ncbi:tetratricopeptide repeat protein [Chondromyces apiculatus]|uniref:Uncharacterized protein n=1 Tax=Chondromyces apiculatus DSM 436 TaxID=1192034 RepID=A0A017T0N0_9BACT|nr:tetratricopeptide repeat protein [Chondromyces apiculatus]EYF02788.1 Hypothetical protein CAP_6523 [Chondromyces apiculatus DSM 436]
MIGRCLAAALALGTAAGCAAPTVTRSVNGELIEGRFVSTRAYALYAIGAVAEAEGNLRLALEAFSEAAGDDGESAEIWTRIGAVRCKLGGDAEGAFEKALGRDGDYEPLFRAQARCALHRGQEEKALGFAERAVALDPEQEAAWLLLAELLEKRGRVVEAQRVLRGWLRERPGSVEGWMQLAGLSRRAGDEAGALAAARRAVALSPRYAGGFAQEMPGFTPLRQVDEALGRGDLEAARRFARKARVSAAELSVRAAALGRVAEARTQAALVVGADPASSSARIALAVAADLAGDAAGLREALGGMPEAGEAVTPPSALARLLFAELLARRVDEDAARAWLKEMPEGREDALTAGVAERVRRRLSRAEGGGSAGGVPKAAGAGAGSVEGRGGG